MVRKSTILPLIIACCVQAAGLKAQTVVGTLAGDGTAGQVDGPAAQAYKVTGRGPSYLANPNHYFRGAWGLNGSVGPSSTVPTK